MARHHLINGIKVPFTSAEESEWDANEAAHAAKQKSTPGYGSDPGGRDLTGGSRSSRGGAPTHSTRSLMVKGGLATMFQRR
mgnify:CR=1 FL=1